MNPKVSVIICTYNRKNLAPRAVNSALAQENIDLEVIAVDDCSNDGTFECLQESYGSRIKVVSTKVNSGVATASNVGFQYSTGAYIALLGDDDYWEDSQKLAKQLQMMKDNPRIGVSGTWWVELQEGGARIEKTPMLPKSRYFFVERMLARGGVICGSTSLIAWQAWKAVGGMDEKQLKGTDSDLFRRITLSGYDCRILHEITTVVDVSHNYSRMTPSQDRAQIVRAISANKEVLKKHFVCYLKYPRALLIRIRSMGTLFLRLLSLGRLRRV